MRMRSSWVLACWVSGACLLLWPGCGDRAAEESAVPDTAADPGAAPADWAAAADVPEPPADPLALAGFPVALGEDGILRIGPLRSFGGGSGPYAGPIAYRTAAAEVDFLLGFYTFSEDESPWTSASVSGYAAGRIDAGAALEVSVAAAGLRTVQVKVRAPEGSNRVSLAFACDGDDRFLGLGAQTAALEHRGARVPIWVSEQGIGKKADLPEDELDILFGGHLYDSYFPVPFFVSPRKGYGLQVEGTSRIVFELCSERADAWRVETWSRELTLTLFSGATPLEVLERAAAWNGRPEMPPDWALLPWIAVKGGSGTVLEKAKALRENGIPASAIWSEDWVGESKNPITGNNLKYHWEWDPEHYPDLPAVIDELHGMDLRFLGYFNPFVSQDFDEWDEAVAGGFLPQTPEGEPYSFPILTFMGSVVDVTNPEARAWVADYMKAGIALGLDGWMADYAEWLPFDAVMHDGRTGAEASSDYPRLWQTLNAEVCSGECLFFARSGFTGSAALTRAVWAGDQNTDFGEDDGLPTAVRIGVGLGLAGVAFYGTDIAGYTSSVSPPSTKELYFRWTAFGAYTPLMRTHEGNLGNEKNWSYDEDAETLEHFRAYARVHTRLFPFLKSLLAEAARTGIPPIRHPALHFPESEAMLAVRDVYLLGPSLLVAPVVEAGATERSTPLPPGSWVLLHDDSRRAGGATVQVPAAIGEIPVLAAEGAVLPMLPSAPETPAGAVKMAGVHLEVVAVLGGDGLFELWDGTKLVLDSTGTADPGPLDLPECTAAEQRGCTLVAGSRRTYRLAGGSIAGAGFELRVEDEAAQGRQYDVVVLFD